MVDVPNETDWTTLESHRAYERREFLAGLAREIARLECPHAIIEIEPEAMYFLER